MQQMQTIKAIQSKTVQTRIFDYLAQFHYKKYLLTSLISFAILWNMIKHFFIIEFFTTKTIVRKRMWDAEQEHEDDETSYNKNAAEDFSYWKYLKIITCLI